MKIFTLILKSAGVILGITISRTKKTSKGKPVFLVSIILIDEIFDFGYWKLNIGKLSFGDEEPHSKSKLVTIINNVGFYTQKIGAFVKFTWKFDVTYYIT